MRPHILIIFLTSATTGIMNLSIYLSNKEDQKEFVLDCVDPFWLGRSAPNENIKSILGLISLIICIPSQICQVLVIYVFVR